MGIKDYLLTYLLTYEVLHDRVYPHKVSALSLSLVRAQSWRYGSTPEKLH